MRQGGAYASRIAALAERVMKSESMHLPGASRLPIPTAARTFGLGIEEA